MWVCADRLKCLRTTSLGRCIVGHAILCGAEGQPLMIMGKLRGKRKHGCSICFVRRNPRTLNSRTGLELSSICCQYYYYSPACWRQKPCRLLRGRIASIELKLGPNGEKSRGADLACYMAVDIFL